MPTQAPKQANLPAHGAARLPTADIASYNLELEDEDGFIGDKASKRAFREALDDVRATLRKAGLDPLGKKASDEISKKKPRCGSRHRRCGGGRGGRSEERRVGKE